MKYAINLILIVLLCKRIFMSKLFHCVSENRREIKNGQSRDTGYIEYTRHRAETNKSEKHNKKTKNDEHHGPHENLETVKKMYLKLF